MDAREAAPQAGSFPSLFQLCLQAAAVDEFWRVQRRQLEGLPEHAANELLRRLVEQRRVTPPQLELFRHSVTAVQLTGAAIGSSWLAHLSAFSALRELRLQRCSRLRDEHLQHLAPLASSLQTLDLGGCSALSGGAAQHLAVLSSLQSLDLSATGLGEAVLASLAVLTQLSSLNLADLPASDDSCRVLGGRLARLRRLVLSGTAVSDEGMRHLEELQHLTALDLSFTQVHSPPVLTTLRQLSMIHCQLGVADDSAQEAIWLQLGAVLPQLEDLQLENATLSSSHGAQLLRRLVAGAAGSLRKLNLSGSSFSGDLAMLAGASALTWLDLSGTLVADHQLPDLSLLPLRQLSLAQTGVGDEGVGQLLATTSLTHLDLSGTRMGDGSWEVLAQLPLLAWLDLSGSRLSLNSLPEGQEQLCALPSLTCLRLLNSRLGDRGCRNLAAALPVLCKLELGSGAVGDRGLKALCARLPKLEALLLNGCEVSDPGLMNALPRCATLRTLALENCWLATPAGLQAAPAAALQAGDQLAELLYNGEAVVLSTHTKHGASRGEAAPAAIAKQHPASAGRAAQSSGGGAGIDSTPATPFATAAAAAAGRASGSSGGHATRARGGARLSPAVLWHDERLQYTLEELQLLAPPAAAEGMPEGGGTAPGGSPAAAASSSSTWQQRANLLRQSLPPDLLS